MGAEHPPAGETWPWGPGPGQAWPAAQRLPKDPQDAGWGRGRSPMLPSWWDSNVTSSWGHGPAGHCADSPTAQKPGRTVDHKPRGSWPRHCAEPPAPGEVGTVTLGPVAVPQRETLSELCSPPRPGGGPHPAVPLTGPASPSPAAEPGSCGSKRNDVTRDQPHQRPTAVTGVMCLRRLISVTK